MDEIPDVLRGNDGQFLRKYRASHAGRVVRLQQCVGTPLKKHDFPAPAGTLAPSPAGPSSATGGRPRAAHQTDALLGCCRINSSHPALQS